LDHERQLENCAQKSVYAKRRGEAVTERMGHESSKNRREFIGIAGGVLAGAMAAPRRNPLLPRVMPIWLFSMIIVN
jgi:hypothetical protein